MEEKNASTIEEELRFKELVNLVRQGDQPSMLELIAFFRTDIDQLSRHLRMPAGEAEHILRVHLLSYIMEQSPDYELS